MTTNFYSMLAAATSLAGNRKANLFGHVRRLLVLVAMVFGVQQAQAFHIMGGEMTYRYVGTSGSNLQYSVTINVYGDRTQGAWVLPNPNDPNSGTVIPINLTVYSADNNSSVATANFGQNNRPAVFFAKPELPAQCQTLTCLNNYVITRSTVTVTFTLPFTFNGYIVSYQDRARNAAITNLQNPASLGISMYQTIPGPQYANSSPQFTDNAVPLIFVGDTTYFVNTAFDPDGDRLVYSFAPALNGNTGNPPSWTAPANCPYNPNYTFNDPLGPNGTSSIDPSTGITKHFCTAPGQYVVAIAIQEFRRLANGTELQIGTTRRELQLLVAEQGNQPGQCPINSTPVQIGSFPTAITLVQGQSTTFNVQYQDPDFNTVELTASGVIMDGSQGYTGPQASFNPLSGTTARGTFTWNTSCNVPPNTYSVIIRAADNGCPPKSIAQVVNITVTKPVGPTAILGSTSPCSATPELYRVNNNLTGFTRQWKVTGGTIVSTSALGDSVRVNWITTPGTVRVVSTSIAGGCKDSVTLTVNPGTITPVVASANPTICASQPTTISATGGNGSYTWATLGGTLVGNASSVTVSPATTTSYVVTSTSGTCQVRDTVIVTVIPRVTASPDVVGCGEFTGQVGPTAVTGYTYAWTASSPVITFLDPVTTARPRIQTGFNPGTYQLFLTATHTASSCVSRDTINVVVNALPPAPAQLAFVICPNTPQALNNGAQAGFTYFWGNTEGFTGGATANTTNPTVNLTNNTPAVREVKYPVTITNTTTNCQRIDTIRVLLWGVEDPTFNQTPQVCKNTPVVIGPTPTTGYTYSWTPASFLSATNVAQPTFLDPTGTSNPVVINYTLTITTDRGCIITKQVDVTSLPGPTVDAGRDATVCPGVPATIGTNASVLNLSYAWSPTTGLANPNLPQTTVTIPTNNTGAPVVLTYVLSVRNTINNCVGTDTVRITVQPSPVANAGADVSICANGSTTIGGAATPGLTYSWSPTTGLSNATSSQPTVTRTNTGTTPIITDYILTVTNNANGCINRDTVQVIILPAVAANAGSDQTTCSDVPVTIGTPAITNFTYAWTPTTGLSSASVAQPTVRIVNTGSTPVVQKYYMTITSAGGGCTSIDSVEVTIQPAIIASAGADVSICSGTPSSIGPATVAAGATYSWSPTVGLSAANVANPAITATNTGTTPLVRDYFLTVTNTANGCVSRDTVTVTVLPAVTADAGANQTTCSNVPTTIGLPGVVNFTYAWTPSTGLSDVSVAQPTVTITNTGTAAIVQKYYLTITSTNSGCTSTDSVEVTIQPSAVADAGADVSFCSGVGAAIGPVSPITSGVTYAWSPAAGLSATNVANPTVNHINATGRDSLFTYVVTVTNTATGCVNTDTVIVTVFPRILGQNVQDSLCAGNQKLLGPAGVTGYTYTWVPANLVQDPTAAQTQLLDVSNSTGSPINVVLYRNLVNTVNGCTSQDTINVRIDPLPVARAGRDTALCSGTAATLGENPVVGYRYQWQRIGNVGGAIFTLSDSLIANPAVAVTTPQGVTATLSFQVTKTNIITGCQGLDTVRVTVNPLPVVAAFATDTAEVCSAQPLQLGAAPVANVSYAWAPATGLTATNIANPLVTRTITGQAAQVFQYVVTATNTTTGCVNTDTVQVRVLPVPEVTLLPEYVSCSGTPVTIGQGVVAGWSYQWLGTTFLNDDTLAQPSYTRTIPNGSASAFETLTLIVSNKGTACRDTFTTVVRINSAPISLAGADVTICSGDSITVGDATRPGLSFAWSGPASTSFISPAGASTRVTALNAGTTPRVDTLIITTNDLVTNCASRDTVLLTVNPRPQIGNIITGSNTVCPNVEGVVYTVANEPGNVYSWTITGGTIVTGQGTNEIIVNWGGSNTAAQVTVLPRNIYNCEGDTAKLDILIRQQLEPRTPVGDTLVCSAQNTVRYTTGSITGSAYTWFWQYDSLGTTITRNSVAGPAFVDITWPVVGGGKVWVRENSTTSTTICEGFSDTLFINVYPTPDSTKLIAGPTAVCETTPSVAFSIQDTPGATFRWVVQGTKPNTGDTLLTGQGTASITIGALVADTVYISVTETSDRGCVGKTIRDTLIINPLPIVKLGVQDSVCSGLPVQIGEAAEAIYSYRWTPSTGLNDDTLANPVLTLTQTGAPASYDYVLTVTNRLTGCVNQDTLSVRVNPLPAALAGADVAICSDDTTTLGAARVGRISYSWSLVNGLQAGLNGGILTGEGALPQPKVTFSNSTQQPVTQLVALLVQDSVTQCLNYDTVAVRVNPRPVVIAFAGDTVRLCADVPTQLGVAPVDSFRYQWRTIPAVSPTGLNDDTLSNPTLTITTSTLLERLYVLTATNRITGCAKSDTVRAIVTPLPTITYNRVDSICSGDSKVLALTLSARARVVWSPATGLNREDSNVVTVSIVNNGTTPIYQRYTLTATDTLSRCVFVDTLMVKVNPLPRAFAGADQVVCTKAVVTLGEAAIPGNTYSWQPGAGLLGTNENVANPTFQVLNPGTTTEVYSYYLTVTSPSGCVKRDTVNITVNPAPGTTLSNLTLCSGQPGQITNLTPNPAHTYRWLTTDSLSSSTDLNATVRRTITGTVAQQFTYLLETTIAATGCKDTASLVLTVNPLPVVAIARNMVSCAKDTITLGGPANVAGTTYAWTIVSVPAGVTPVLSSLTTSQPRFTATNTTNAPQYVRLQLVATTTATGCTNTDTSGVLVNPLPRAVAHTAPSITLCSNQPGGLGVSPEAGRVYSWSPQVGLSDAASANPTISLTNPTQQVQQSRYVLTVRNTATNCVDTSSVLVIINPLPIVNVGSASQACSTVPLQIGAPAVAGYSYRWSPATNLSNASVADPLFIRTAASNAIETFDYKLVVTNVATGCKDSATLTVTVNPLPGAFAGADVRTCSRVPVTLGGVSTTNVTFDWQPATGLSANNVSSPVFNLQNTTGTDAVFTYVLTVTSIGTGCISKDTVVVTLSPEPVTQRVSYDSLVCRTTLNNRSYSVQGLPSSQYTWFVTGGTAQGGIQNGVPSSASTITVDWDSTATAFGIKVVETSVNGCSNVDTVRFPVVYTNFRLTQLSVTHDEALGDSALLILYRVTRLGTGTAAAPVTVYRRVQGSGQPFVAVGTTPDTDSVYVDRQINTSAFIYEYYLSLADGCGNVTISQPVQTNLRLQGTGVAENSTSRLSWNAYQGWSTGVARYEIYRKLDNGDYGITPYAIVDGGTTNWQANNGTDGFVQTYKVIAVQTGTSVTAVSNEVVLEFQNALKGYNVITPNGDGYNDVLSFDNLKLYGNVQLRIFNRNGALVFETGSYANDWNGDNVPAGTYMYQLKVTGSRERTINGYVEVMK